MQERLSDFVISFALFVVAVFWVWKHMKTGATTRASVHCAARVPLALFLSLGSALLRKTTDQFGESQQLTI